MEVGCSLGVAQREIATCLGIVSEHGVGKARQNLRTEVCQENPHMG
jgi:hypothetical protein